MMHIPHEFLSKRRFFLSTKRLRRGNPKFGDGDGWVMAGPFFLGDFPGMQNAIEGDAMQCNAMQWDGMGGHIFEMQGLTRILLSSCRETGSEIEAFNRVS